MCADGKDFQPILNVFAALKQGNPELMDICLRYPNKLAPQEYKEKRKEQGFIEEKEFSFEEILEESGKSEESSEDESSNEKYEESSDDGPQNEDSFFKKKADESGSKIRIHYLTSDPQENIIKTYEPQNGIENEDVVEFDYDEEEGAITEYKPSTNKFKVQKPKRPIKFNINEEFGILFGIQNLDSIRDAIQYGISQAFLKVEVTDRLNIMCERLLAWVNKNNKNASKRSKDNEERKLGYWACHRRQDKKENKLSNEMIKKLENIPYWFWDAENEREADWWKIFNEIKEVGTLPKHVSDRKSEEKKSCLAHHAKEKILPKR